jgi:glycosyltransferase involved in cell wall biosynthesis
VKIAKRFRSQVPKILFIHNTAVWYRRPFFRKLSEIYDVKFIFTQLQLQKDVYGVEIANRIEGLEVVNYKVLNSNICGKHGLIKDLLSHDCDVIVDSLGSIETVLSFSIAKLRGKPIMLWSEEWGWREKSLRRRLNSPVVDFIVSHSEAMLVPGTKHREHVLSSGASPDRVFIMPNASNLIASEKHYQDKQKLKEKLHIGAKKVVLYAGRLVKRKGVEYLIEAFSKLRKEADDIVLIIVGEGECRGELELKSKVLNIEDHVYFAGSVDNSQLPPYYLLCDVCVVPSTTYGMGDPWVFVVNEAMHCGKPVIATDAVGAAFDMIKNGQNGFVVPERDSNALYEAMKMILSDPGLQEEMGKQSKRIIEEGFTYEHMVEGFMKALNHVLENKGYH